MQENERPSEAWTGCYKIAYIGEEPEITEKELFDTVFSKLEKMQKQAMLEKIKQADGRKSLFILFDIFGQPLCECRFCVQFLHDYNTASTLQKRL